MSPTDRENYIRAAFSKVADDLIALDRSRNGSVTIHFQNGGLTLKDEWRFLGRLVTPPVASAILTEPDM